VYIDRALSTRQLLEHYVDMASPEGVVRQPVSFQSEGETLVGEVVLPEGPGPHPAVLFVAGTGSQNRQGDFYSNGRWHVHGLYRLVADRLARAGIASLCWDKRGVGASSGGDREPGDDPGNRDAHANVLTDVADAQQALNTLLNHPLIDNSRIAVQGKSAGVYFSCLLAACTTLPAAYVFWGGVHRDIVALMEYIYGQLEAYCARGTEYDAWIRETLPGSYQIHRNWRAMLAAAQQDKDVFLAGHGEEQMTVHLERLKFELANPLADQFRHVKKPTLVIHGERDLNVPVEDAFLVRHELIRTGNQDVAVVTVPGADHSMHVAPTGISEETRILERLSHGSMRHPVSEFFVSTLIGWLKCKLVNPED
jgi:dipeptidyl aminopeptidase/acylaminoacyl peptidase